MRQNVWCFRLEGWISLNERCAKNGLAILDVPGDGNCMLWSLRALLLGPRVVADCSNKAAKKQAMQCRKLMKYSWMEKCEDGRWQDLFKILCCEYAGGPELLNPVTPTKGEKGPPEMHPEASASDQGPTINPEEEPALATPPRPEPKKKSSVPRAGKSAAVPITKKSFPASPVLMQPRKKRKPTLVEPECPDVEEAYHDIQMKVDEQLQVVQRSVGCNDVDPSACEPEMLDSDSEDRARQGQRKRKYHTREKNKREKPNREVALEDLVPWLARHGVRYHTWQTFHKAGAGHFKAGACTFGKWKQFTEKLIAEDNTPPCEVCASFLMRKKHVRLDLISKYVREGFPKQERKDLKADESQVEQKKAEEADVHVDESELSWWEQCVNLVRSYSPVLEPVFGPGPLLRYQCTVCTTKKQKEGKINKLGSSECMKDEGALKKCKFLLNQHLDSATHVGRLQERQLHEERMQASTEEVSCCSLCATGEQREGIHIHPEEMHLWVTHSDMASEKLKHSYSFEKGNWWIRHKDCKGTFERTVGSDQEVCDLCRSLGHRHSVASSIVRFCNKHMSARLLHKRLFESPDEVKQFVDDMNRGAYARNHKKKWQNLVKMNNAELQQEVRKTFKFVPHQTRTKAFDLFYSMVVEPALKVHVTALGSQVQVLSAQFVHALSKGQFDALWLSISRASPILLFPVPYKMEEYTFLFPIKWKSTTRDNRYVFFLLKWNPGNLIL